MISAGYAIPDIAALKAIGANDRVDGYARLVKKDKDGFPAWYMFDASSTIAADDIIAILPNDNPTAGRYLRVGYQKLSDSEGGDNTALTNVWRSTASDYTALSGDKVAVITNSNNAIITLPPNPALYDEISLVYYSNNPSNVLYINFNGNKLNGKSFIGNAFVRSDFGSGGKEIFRLIFVELPEIGLSWIAAITSQTYIQGTLQS